ncbi:MAG: UpxY family transcription antiterminator [Bacteroidales bacterium]|nr:UpxY family transcription antiterminator [Bacteroidales bacterium]
MTAEKKWYAIYTKSRTEKKVYQELIASGVETYLPLIKTLKQWSDRKKWVEEPLFRSYLFVNITDSEYYRVLSSVGVVRYITFEGKAVTVPPKQILAIKQFINEEEDFTVDFDHFEIGDSVEVIRGSLMGLCGNLTEERGKQKVKIEIESVGKSILITIPRKHLRILR